MSTFLLKKQLRALFARKKNLEAQSSKDAKEASISQPVTDVPTKKQREKQRTANYKRNLSYFQTSEQKTEDLNEALNKVIETLKDEAAIVKRRKLELSSHDDDADSEKNFDQERLK